MSDELVAARLGPLVAQTGVVANALLLYGAGPQSAAWLRQNALERLSETFERHDVKLAFTSRASIGIWRMVLKPTLLRIARRLGLPEV